MSQSSPAIRRDLSWSSAATIFLALFFCAAESFSQAAPDSSAEMTLAQFRSRVEARLTEQARAASRPREKLPPPDLRVADEAFRMAAMVW